MRIAGVASAFPRHYYSQEDIVVRLEEAWGQEHFNRDRLRRLHENVLVGGRHLALPIDQYDQLSSWGEANDAWIEVGQEVGEMAVRKLSADTAIPLAAIGAFFFVSVTGLSVPSLDARLMNRLSLCSGVRRTPIFGLGCSAGAAGIARAADYVRAYPEQVALLLSVELCSLTLQRQDLSIPNLIASGLFGDGGAAALVVGEQSEWAPASRPRILASRSVFYPNSEEVMGWDIGPGGFKVVLSARVPQVVEEHLRSDVDAFLFQHGLERRAISRWICHPGGPKVLAAMARALEVEDGDLEPTWKSLREVGNLSSTSVLLVLEQALEQPPAAGEHGVILAMGPGFCSELVLVRW